MPRSDERLRGMRIVYLHGIGCSRGTCERHIHLPALREAGATVICPNLHTGWEDWTECNSLLRHMLRQPLLWACINFCLAATQLSPNDICSPLSHDLT